MAQTFRIDLTGRTALVTGASKGLGRAMALGLAKGGCDLALCARDAAGLLSTLLSDADFRSSEVGGLLEKYFAGKQGFSTEDKRKLCRYIEGMTSVSTLVEALHGAGSPQAQRIVMLRQADLPEKMRQAKKVIGLKGGK